MARIVHGVYHCGEDRWEKDYTEREFGDWMSHEFENCPTPGRLERLEEVYKHTLGVDACYPEYYSDGKCRCYGWMTFDVREEE